MTVTATNQTGWQIQRFDHKKGWQDILPVPLEDKQAAQSILDRMPLDIGEEYRVYPALKGNS